MTIQHGVTSSDRLDEALQDFFAFAPSQTLLAQLDERLITATEALAGSPPTSLRHRRSRPRRTAVGLMAAAALLVAAGGAAVLYNGMGGGLDVGFGLQLDRSVAVGATEVHDGYRVTIDRAYLDRERLMLAIRVVDELERPEIGQLMSMYAIVTDQDGAWGGGGFATSRPTGQWSATNVLWALAPVAPLPDGSRDLHVVFPHIFVRDTSASAPPTDDSNWNPWRQVDGPWTFDIALAVDHGGVVAKPDAVNTIAGVPVTMKQAIVGPSAIRIQMAVDDQGSAHWMLLGEVRHGGQAFPLVLSSQGDDGVIEMTTDGGTDDASGEWTLVINEATRQGADGATEERLSGPWTFEFQVP